MWERKTEYSRYFYASFYKPREVDKIMNEVTGLTKNADGEFVRGPARENRENFISRPRRGRRTGSKKFVLVTQWDPRNPDISDIIRRNSHTLFLSRKSIKGGFLPKIQLSDLTKNIFGDS